MPATNYEFSSTGAEKVAADVKAIGAEHESTAAKVARSSQDSSAALEALNTVSEKTQETLHEMSGEAGILGDILVKLGPAGLAAGAAIGGLTAVLVEGVKAADDFERSHLKLQAALNATDYASGQSAEQIRTFAEGMAASTMATVDGVEAAAQELLAFRTVTGSVFTETLKLAQDMAASGFGTLSENAVRLGRALEDPDKGMQQLRRSGVVLSQTIQDQIKDLEAHGEHLQAQGILIDALTKKFGGVGEADADTLTGAWHKWRQEVEISEQHVSVFGGLASWLAEKINALAAAEKYLRETAMEGDGALQANILSTDQLAKMVAVGTQAQITDEAVKRRWAGVLSDTHDLELQIADDREKAAKKLQDELDKEAEKRAALIADLTIQSDARAREAEATTEGKDALFDLNTQLEIEANIRKLGADATQLDIEQVTTQTILKRDAIEAQKAYNDAKALEAKVFAEVDAQEQKSADEAAKRLQKQVDDEAKAVQKMAVDLGSHIVDAFINMAEGAKKPFDALLQYAKHIFEQVVAAALLNPIIVPLIVDAIGGVGGAAGGGAAGALSTGAGVVSLAGQSGLVSLGGLSLSGGIDSLGYAAGIGGQVSGSAAAGNMAITPYLSTYLGSAAVGGGLGYAFGALTGGNKNISTAAGTAAGVAFALGQPEIAAAIAAIGAVGSLIFGNHPSDKLEGDWLNLTAGTQTPYGYTGAKFSQDNANQASQLGQSVIGFGQILTAAGLTPNFATNARVEVGDRGSPYRVWYGGINGDQQNGQFQTAQDAFQAIASEILKSLGTVPADIQKAIDNIDWSNLKAFTDQLNEIAAFHVTLAQVHAQLEQIKDPKQYELDQLDAQFQPILDEANKLGEDTSEIEELWGLKRKAIVDKYASQITTTVTNALGQTTQAVVTAVADWSQVVGQYYDQQMNAVQAQLGAAQQLHDAWAGIQASLGATRSGLLVDSNLSPLSLEGRTVEAKSQFDAAFSKAMGGDQQAAASLGDLAKAFLTADMAFEHGNEQYAADFSEIMAKLGQAQSYAGAQVTVEQLQLDALNAILKTLQQQKAALGGGQSPNYNAADGQSLTGSFGAALAASGQSAADYLHSPGGSVWIAARNQLIQGTTDPALLTADLTNFKNQAATPGLQDIGQSGIDATIAQFKSLGLPIPSYDVGSSYVPRTGLAMVHAGERVLTASDNSGLSGEVAALRATVAAMGEQLAGLLCDVVDNTGRAADAPYDVAVLNATNNRTRVL